MDKTIIQKVNAIEAIGMIIFFMSTVPNPQEAAAPKTTITPKGLPAIVENSPEISNKAPAVAQQMPIKPRRVNRDLSKIMLEITAQIGMV